MNMVMGGCRGAGSSREGTERCNVKAEKKEKEKRKKRAKNGQNARRRKKKRRDVHA